MDPWQPCPASNPISGGETIVTNVDDLALQHEEVEEEPQQVEISNSGVCELKEELSFGDDFQPFVKLPDSDQYLESLEKKLKKIQKGGQKGATAESILKSLGQTKESCMLKLLSNSVEKLTVEGELFEELKVNPLLKKLAPEKQALSAEELVHLLKADQLEIILRNLNNEDEQEPSSSSIEEIPSAEPEIPETITEKKSTGETEKDKDSTEDLTSSGHHPQE